VVRQRPAKPRTAVRVRSAPLSLQIADVSNSPCAAFPVYDAGEYQSYELQPGPYLFNQDRLVWLFE
jgi:hypothetical protein